MKILNRICLIFVVLPLVAVLFYKVLDKEMDIEYQKMQQGGDTEDHCLVIIHEPSSQLAFLDGKKCLVVKKFMPQEAVLSPANILGLIVKTDSGSQRLIVDRNSSESVNDGDQVVLERSRTNSGLYIVTKVH